jgi:hypothetical protein
MALLALAHVYQMVWLKGRTEEALASRLTVEHAEAGWFLQHAAAVPTRTYSMRLDDMDFLPLSLKHTSMFTTPSDPQRIF